MKHLFTEPLVNGLFSDLETIDVTRGEAESNKDGREIIKLLFF